MMKVFVLSIGEITTKLCCEKLEEFGFDVVLLDQKCDMKSKYQDFITKALDAGGTVLKIDADVIPNENIKNLVAFHVIVQPKIYNFYTNNVGFNGVTLYPNEFIKTIHDNLNELSDLRPESSALRLKEVNDYLVQSDDVVGLHGFFQSDEDMQRVKVHTLARKHKFDDDFINKVKELCDFQF